MPFLHNLEFTLAGTSFPPGYGDVMSGALLHQLPILERADALAQLRESNREKFSRYPGERESEKFSAWLSAELGVGAGYSWKYLDRYQRLTSASPEMRSKIMAAKPQTPRQAFLILDGPPPVSAPRPDVDGDEHVRVIKLGSSFLNALEECPKISQTVEALLLQIIRDAKKRLRHEPRQHSPIAHQLPQTSWP